MTETKKNENSMARLTLILFAITAVTALLLGLVNYITADKIQAITEEKTAAAMAQVLEAETYTEVPYTGTDGQITAIFEADDLGHVVRLSVSGSQGMIDMVVGVDTNGAVTGVSIVDMSETAGLGSKAADESFTSQFVGTTGGLSVNKDGGTIDALTGATVTSRAVTNGVNAAVEAVATLG
jgi:electron transport complex protein RnfG